MDDRDRWTHWMVMVAIWVTLSLIIGLASCATAGSLTEPLPTLQILNDDAAPLQLLIDDGHGARPWRRVYPGISCLVLMRHEGTIAIGIRKLAETQIYWTPAFTPASQPGWALRIGQALPVDIWSFQGVAERCGK